VNTLQISTPPVVPRLLTKLAPPRLKRNLLHREHLLDFLHQSDVKLLIISAPTGYGKTTLLADYTAHSQKPFCWLTLDRIDRDPAVFLESLVTCIGRVYPDFVAQSQFIPELIKTIVNKDAGPEVCSRLLANQIYEYIPDDFDLLLDDYHIVEDSAEINQLLSAFLNYMPSHCRILLSSRTISALDLTGLMLRGEVVGLGVHDLQLSTEEASRLLNEQYQLTFEPTEINELISKTEGWIAGILLGSSRVLRHRSHNVDFSNRQQIFAYLKTEVLEQLPPQLQTFLMETSILEDVQPDFCDRLLETTNAAESLRECERRCLFVSRLENLDPNDQSRTYRHHNLFRDYLQEVLKTTKPNRYQELQARSAYLYKEQGNITRMMWHFAQSHDYDSLISELFSISENELRAGHTQSILSWLEALPANLVESYPELMLLRAQVLGTNGNFAEAYAMLDKIQTLLDNRQPVAGLKMAQAIALRGRMLRLETQYNQAVQTLQRGLGLLNNLTDGIGSPAYQNTKAETYLELGISLGMEAQYSLAFEALQAACDLYEPLNNSERLAHVHHCMSLIYAGLNDTASRQRHLETSLQYWQKTDNVSGLTNTLVNLADLHIVATNYSTAQEILDKAFFHAQKAGYQLGKAYVFAFKGDLARAKKQYTEATDFYRQAEEIANNFNDRRLAVLVCREIAGVLRLLGDYIGANEAFNRAFRTLSAAQQTSGLMVEVLRLLQAAIEIDQGNLARARQLLDISALYFDGTENARELCLKHFLDARLSFSLGKHKPALVSLTFALQTDKDSTRLGLLRQEALHALPLLQFAKAKLTRNPSLLEQIDRLLALAKEKEENQPESLTPQAFPVVAMTPPPNFAPPAKAGKRKNQRRATRRLRLWQTGSFCAWRYRQGLAHR
jgi:LuxR family transcriptional regulator, maltose regulon positive regulatory protein